MNSLMLTAAWTLCNQCRLLSCVKLTNLRRWVSTWERVTNTWKETEKETVKLPSVVMVFALI
jgi:hypothetical protein